MRKVQKICAMLHCQPPNLNTQLLRKVEEILGSSYFLNASCISLGPSLVSKKHYDQVGWHGGTQDYELISEINLQYNISIITYTDGIFWYCLCYSKKSSNPSK